MQPIKSDLTHSFPKCETVKGQETGRFCVDVNTKYTDKIKPGDKRFWAFNMSFTSCSVTLPELLLSIRRGHAWTAPHEKIQHEKIGADGKKRLTTYRVKQNIYTDPGFIQLWALDLETGDGRSDIANLKNDPWLRANAAFIHTTASHSLPDNPRARVVFATDGGLSIEAREIVADWVHSLYPHADRSINQAAAVCYGAVDCQAVYFGNVILADWLNDNVITPELERRRQEAADREKQRQEAAQRRAGRGLTIAGGQVAAYVRATVDAVLQGVSTCPAGGTGKNSRHGMLLSAGVRLYGLEQATWLDQAAAAELAGIDQLLRTVATANGYTEKYGEDQVKRVLNDARDYADPAQEPEWKESGDAYNVGDTAAAPELKTSPSWRKKARPDSQQERVIFPAGCGLRFPPGAAKPLPDGRIEAWLTFTQLQQLKAYSGLSAALG